MARSSAVVKCGQKWFSGFVTEMTEPSETTLTTSASKNLTRPTPSSPREFFKRLYGHLEKHSNTEEGENEEDGGYGEGHRLARTAYQAWGSLVGPTANRVVPPVCSARRFDSDTDSPAQLLLRPFASAPHHSFPPGLTAFCKSPNILIFKFTYY